MKTTWYLPIMAGMFLLAACNHEEELAGNEAEELPNEEQATPIGEEVLSAEHILSQTNDAMEQIDSLRTAFTMSYTLAFSDAAAEESEKLEFGFDMTVDAIMEPIAFQMTTSITEFGMEMELDQYVVDGYLYMQEPMIGEWLRMDVSEELEGAEALQVDSQEQIVMLQDVQDYIDVKEENDSYVLNLQGNEEASEEFIYSFIEMGQGDQIMANEEVEITIDNLEIEEMHYSLIVDKETFLQESMSLDVTIGSENEDETFSLNLFVEGAYSMYGEIDRIEVPQEAIENALDIEEGMMNEPFTEEE